MDNQKYTSRAGEKLAYALIVFDVDVQGKICADFGASTGGFTDCLLQNGATKIYAVDTSYGELHWKLRQDSRVDVLERTNAMHVILPEKADLVVVDVGWTKLEAVIPNALKNLASGGTIIALLKPHYEMPKLVKRGKLSLENAEKTKQEVRQKLSASGARIIAETRSPIVGKRAGNVEYLLFLECSSNVLSGCK